MKVDFLPLTANLIPACREFNTRLRQHTDPPFLLPESVSAESVSANNVSRADAGISTTHYVAVDAEGSVRGGVLLAEQYGWLNQKIVRLINIQSPLSEGLVDRRFAGIGLQMLKFVNGHSPYCYAVGMGDAGKPFPRLLRAAGWLLQPVPFAFSVIGPRRFLSEIAPLRLGYRKWLARAAAGSGLAPLASAAWRFAHPEPTMRGYSLELASSWPAGTDAVWEQCRRRLTFSAMRDKSALDALYPLAQLRLNRFVLRASGKIVGWPVGVLTPMKDDPNFGDLAVGTILDGLATEGDMIPLVALTRNAMQDMGAELILTNQSHAMWRTALRRLGFLNHSSNYLVALSNALSAALAAEPDAMQQIHLNRGDGDGRVHV